jgi:NAD(P)-dependent dehydrogenase (short-subunit alcohol dehydrogenase family)/SAM-dependent methyltransferase/acyl carrier protein
LADTYNIEAYHTLFPDLDALSYRYILEALRELGWQETVGSQVTTAELSGKLGIVPPHRRLFARLLSILKEEGMVQEVGEGWEVMQEWKTAVSSQTLPTATDLQTRYLHDDAELHLLQQCGSHLATILRGDQDPLQLLFPDGSTAATTRVYAETPFAKIYNQLVGNAVSHIQDALPPDRTLRILEIGAGTGSTTASVLPQLTATNVEYHFTDLSPLFLSKAQEKFATYPFMQYSLLDIEQTPAEEGQFDIIIAANVLHATPDLGQTLGHVAQRLAPGGLLLLLEGSGRQRWVDLTFGLTEGWWKFTDIDVRQESPLVDSAQWQALLAAAGFTAVSTLPANPPNDLFDLQTIYVAQRPQSTELASGSWLIFSDEAGVGAALAETIEAAGETAVLVTPGSNFQQLNENRYALNPANPADYTHLLETVSVQGILHLWSLETPPLAGLDEAGITAVHAKTVQSGLLLAQAVGKLPAQPPRLWFATQDAQPALAPPTNPLAAPMWGLGRVLALEHPTWWGGTVDLDASSSVSQQAATLWQELQQPDGEDQIAHRGGTRLVARLVRATPTPASSLAVSAEGSYLLTGGLGGLGVEIANWLAAQGARHLVLTSRQGLPPRDEWGNLPADSEMARRTTAVRSLEAQGVTVHIAAVDVADRTQMTDLFAQFGDTLPPLRGIIHAAVAMTSYPIAAMPPAALSDMLAAKVQGSWLLHQLSEKMALDFFVLFSSTTALWGVAGLGHYAAANQFMDSLAYYRQAQGLPAVSFNWGTWDVMRVASSAEQDEMARFGLQRMATKQALSALEALGAGAMAQWVVADVDWQTLKGVYEAKRPKPFLSLVADLPAPSSAPVQPKEKTAEAPQLRQQLAGRNASERRRLVAAQVKQAVAQVLGIPAARLTDTQQGLFDMGMDSLMSVELKGLLETAVAQTLPSTLTFNYPTIDDLAEFLDTEILAAVVVAEEEEETAVVAESADDDDESTEIDDLSEDDLAAMLLAKLGNLD